MRSPDPRVTRYRAHINVAALALIGLGLLTIFDPRLQKIGLGVLFVTFIGWVYLTNRVTPTATDYVEHLRAAAENAGHDEWLADVEAEFKELWGIEDLEDLE